MAIDRPETRYAATPDGVEIAYQVFGSGPRHIVWLQHFLFDIDLWWDCEPVARWLEGLASLGTVLIRDLRGTGLSDRSVEPAEIGTDIADLIAVMDRAGIDKAALIGNLRGAAMCVLAAAIHPDRVSELILWNPMARAGRAPDYPFGASPDDLDAALDAVSGQWGTDAGATSLASEEGPMGSVDLSFQRWMARMMRSAVTPTRARLLWTRMYETDVRDVLPAVRVPTLVLAREEASPDEAAWIASRIPGSTTVILPGGDLMPWFGDLASVVEAMRDFLGVAHPPASSQRFLATVLLTDIVGSTERAAALGDRAWRQALSEHDHLVRERLGRFGGREQDSAGDGFFAAFDTPADAIRCGMSISSAVQALGLHVRAGVHAGECHIADGKVAGMAVTIGARVAAVAGPDEVLVTSTVKVSPWPARRSPSTMSATTS